MKETDRMSRLLGEKVELVRFNYGADQFEFKIEGKVEWVMTPDDFEYTDAELVEKFVKPIQACIRRNKMSDDADVERLINAKGLNGPRVTPALIDEQIVSEAYYVFPNTTLTVCALTLQNGYQVVGHSACADPSNFDEELGRTIARRNARQQIWALEGYLLKAHLYATQLPGR